MRKYFLSLILAVILAGFAAAARAGGGQPDPSDRRMANFDAIASLRLQAVGACSGVTGIMIDLIGPTEVKLSRRVRGGAIPAEIVLLKLTGGRTALVADGSVRFLVSVVLDPNRMSVGQIIEPEDRPAESFFDVFFDLKMMDTSGGIQTLSSRDPVRLRGILIGLLPPFDTRFESNQAVTFFLPPVGSLPPNPCLELQHMTFVPANASDAIIKRELIQIEEKLDRLLNQNEPTPPPQSDL